MSSTTQPITQSTSMQRKRLLGHRGLVGIAIGLGILVVMAGYIAWRMTYVPGDLDLSTTRKTSNSFYQLSIQPEHDPITVNQMHRWTVHVATPDGQPVSGAEIDVDGGMPQHGHGLPTRPLVTADLGNGDYLVEGMKFNMPGWWVVTFDVATNAGDDQVTFNLMLD